MEGQKWNWLTDSASPRICMVAAAAAAKSLQSCPTLCDPIDGSPPGPSIPGILQARVLEWGVENRMSGLVYCLTVWLSLILLWKNAFYNCY